MPARGTLNLACSQTSAPVARIFVQLRVFSIYFKPNFQTTLSLDFRAFPHELAPNLFLGESSDLDAEVAPMAIHSTILPQAVL